MYAIPIRDGHEVTGAQRRLSDGCRGYLEYSKNTLAVTLDPGLRINSWFTLLEADVWADRRFLLASWRQCRRDSLIESGLCNLLYDHRPSCDLHHRQMRAGKFAEAEREDMVDRPAKD
jgi:hypothetical protein